MARVSTRNAMLGVRPQHTATMVTTHDSILCIAPRHPALRMPTRKSTSQPHPSKCSGIEWRASQTRALDTPTNLARKHRLSTFHLTNSVAEWYIAVQRDVVESEIPDGRIHHSVRAEGEDGPDDGAGETVVPVVELVDGEGARDEGRAEDGGVDGD